MKFFQTKNPGFTLIEMVVTITILLILIGLSATSFVPKQGKPSLDTTITTLIADLKTQQTKAMTGDNQGSGSQGSYGVHFDATSYTLFKGASYNSSDTSNFKPNIDSSVTFTSIAFSQGNVIFATGSGEILNFVAGQNTVTLKNTVLNEQKTVTINRYGVVTQVN